MAKRIGITLASAAGGILVWKLGDGSTVELNKNKLDAAVRTCAEDAGFHRAISNIGAGKDKADWPSIRREMERRIRGMRFGQWKTNIGGYGFADHVEAVVRISAKAGTPRTYEDVSDKLLAMSSDERTAHAALPLVKRVMAEIALERMALASDDDSSGDVLAGL